MQEQLHAETAGDELDSRKEFPRNKELLYSIDEVPPWYLCIVLGLQHYLAVLGGTLSIPFLLAPALCMEGDDLAVSQIVSTIFFVSGLCTLLQTTIGCRLPLLQGGTASFLVPTLAIMKLDKWCCPFNDKNFCGLNETALPALGSPDHKALWQARITEIQGAIMVSSLFQVAIGFSGIIGFVLGCIGPLTITPLITLIGLSFFSAGANQASGLWWVAIMTIIFITIFSQYLRDIDIPTPSYKRGQGCTITKQPLLRLFPVILGMCLSWLVCFILTVSGALPDDPKKWGYLARTDSRIDVLHNASWFRFPYPGQWGTPTVSIEGVFAMLGGVLASIIESVGDYYACARLSGAPSPPDHAINRGIAVGGIGCLLAGAWGSGNGTTSYVSVIGVTKVGSRRVVQMAGMIMIFLACLGKFGALFVTIPVPVIGGMFIAMFGIVTAVGLSSLQFVDLNSPRNLFILGFSIFFGLSLPDWIGKNRNAIKTGSEIADQILTVLCSTNMFVGGIAGFILDNTVPGSYEERGLTKWGHMLHTKQNSENDEAVTEYRVYDLPLLQKYFKRWTVMSYLPVCPSFRGSRLRSSRSD